MGAIRKSDPRFTEAEYFAYESVSPEKHEFYRGEIFAMAGNSFAHVVICTNLLTALSRYLRGPCRPFESNLRIKCEPNSLITYADVSVFCEEPNLVRHEQGEAATNPTVLFEVLSKSTENYDRGSKFDLYRDIPSLRAVVLISQFEVLAEVFTWDGDGVHSLEFRGLDESLRVPCLHLDLPLAELYRGLSLSGPSAFRILEEAAEQAMVSR